MIGQVVTVGGTAGTVIRIIDGALMVAASITVFWMARPRWRANAHTVSAVMLAIVWAVCGALMVGGTLGAFPTTWVPWSTHGALIVASFLLVHGAASGRKAHQHTERSLRPQIDAAMEERS